MRGWRAASLLLFLGLCFGCSGPSDSVKPPKAGACHDLSSADVQHSTDDSDPVSCKDKHTAQTFLVGELPKSTGAQYADRRHGAWVHKTCTTAFEKFLGIDESMALRTRLSWAWFRASKSAWEKGARWFRCDVIGGQPDAGPLKALPRTAKGLLAKEEVSAWMTCAKGENLASAKKIFCSQPHDWRAVTAVKIGLPDESWPGDKVSEARARTRCSDWVGAWMHYPPDYEFAYSTFHAAEWKAGNRRAVCWARTDK